MRFRRSTLFLIKEKHIGINLFVINFVSMKGNNIVDPNDGSVTTPVSEVKKEGDDSKDAEDVEMLLVSTLSQSI